MQHCLFFTRILKMSCKAAIKSICKISVHKYYVVGIKTVVVYVVVAIKCIKRRVFSLHAVRKIFSQQTIVLHTYRLFTLYCTSSSFLFIQFFIGFFNNKCKLLTSTLNFNLLFLFSFCVCTSMQKCLAYLFLVYLPGISLFFQHLQEK